MARTVVECVPNFSEGRDPRLVDAIVDAIAGVAGVVVLGRESDADHNRSVVTFAGAPHAVAEGAVRGIAKAAELIDLTRHAGVHPRIGAADVVPFVPVEGATLADCVRLAEEAGAEVWRRLRVPVYLYEAAARCPDRRRLENIRRGGFAWLRDHVAERPPDIGDAALHPTAGAAIIGARKLLVAFNINLTTDDVEIARSIARAVRESSGGLPSVKAIGVPLESLGLAQVSMNLTAFEQTGLGQVFDAVQAQAARHGVSVATSQIIGLIPRRALNEASATLLRCENFTPDRVLEDRIAALMPYCAFDDFLNRISGPAAAALAGALGAALGHRIARAGGVEAGHFLGHREFFAQAADILEADSNQHAATAAAELTGRAKELDRDLLRLKEQAAAKVQSDITTALALARACRAGGIAAARANLPFIEDAGFRQAIEDQLDRRPL